MEELGLFTLRSCLGILRCDRGKTLGCRLLTAHMSDIGPRDVAPVWLWLATAASGVLGVISFLLGGAPSVAAGPLAGVAVVGGTVLLYRWGQLRDDAGDGDGDNDGDNTDRRDQEAEARRSRSGWG